ncbi:hypothetical protein EV363DRAFT_1295908 [Boletus edulis]|nr:hypothetical protein EV363DRAFT_1295908 [Boletus edulis]
MPSITNGRHSAEVNEKARIKRMKTRRSDTTVRPQGLLNLQVAASLVIEKQLVNQAYLRSCAVELAALRKKPHQFNILGGMTHVYGRTCADKPTWCRPPDAAVKFREAMSNLIGPSLRSFAERLCQEYLATGNYASLDECTTALGRLEINLCNTQAEHVQCGYHNHSSFLQVELDHVRIASRVIEDMLCHAMEGSDVAKLQNRGLLHYQSIPDLSFVM